MGCLNSEGQFEHWFANVHLSGPCNRSCYFCIGQHMMALDSFNSLDTWPMAGVDAFIAECKQHNLKEICLTGTNTDPGLFKHHNEFVELMHKELPGIKLAIRTNAAFYKPEIFALYDKASITVCSMDPEIYVKMMGQGKPPDVARIVEENPKLDLKVNLVLGPENVTNHDYIKTLHALANAGVHRVNLREPYGQPHIGNPFEKYVMYGEVLGMPQYRFCGMSVVYWNVHFVEVESVNLYASGRVSVTYPISKGHAETGEVHDQTYFPGGRVTQQWVKITC
jgi:molybdenum cofactor biosynthesis enzyme MoaA